MSNNILLYPIFVPIIFGLLVMCFKRKIWSISFAVTVFTFILSVLIFVGGNLQFGFDLGEMGIRFSLKSYDLSAFILMAIAFFSCIIVIYSLKFIEKMERVNEYYGNILITLGASCGAVLSTNLVIFLVFWGISGLTLYNLINLGGPNATGAAKKTFVIVGGTDAIMVLGISIIWYLTGTFDMDSIRLPLQGALPIIAYLALAAPALAKAGAIPFHTWIPDSAEVAPTSVMAYLPASLDKLLGIYLLARISLDLFIIVPNSFMSVVLLTVGSVTIIAAVLAALVQHNLKKLLSFHAVSQVGYMVMGIGTGVPVGIAGGLFHMINHAIYKCCLFLGGGAVEREAGTSELDKLGGLASVMPITFITTLIAALAISGIPPFNGFFSKWMIYQGVIELGKSGGGWWIIWLVAAMFGSALTLASFMKLIHATFLGKMSVEIKPGSIKETPPAMWIPMVILAVLCVLFGIFAFELPLHYFILPVIPFVFFSGLWSPVLAATLIIVGLAIGAGIYFLGKTKGVRRDAAFIGGEVIPEERLKVSGVRFYDTIRELPIVAEFYDEAEAKLYDIYEILSKVTFFFFQVLRRIHDGLLHTYLAWCLIGLVLLFIVLIR